MKKKVKPKSGNGAFDLVASTSNTAGFQSSLFDGAGIKAGERREKVPGTYNLQAQAFTTPDGQTPS